MIANKLFDPGDYKQPLYAEMRRYFDSWWYILALEGVKFSYSDRNRAWEYAQIVASADFESKRVLDLGTSGSLAPIFLVRRLGCTVTTFDMAWTEERQTLYAAAGIADSVGVDTGNLLEPLPYRDDSYDIVASWSVIEHLPQVDGLIAEMRRVCKPGGIIALTTDYSDVPPDSGKSGATYDRAALERLITKFGLPMVGDADYDNVDLTQTENRAVRGEYTFASLVLENS